MKPMYAAYAAHCLRFTLRHLHDDFGFTDYPATILCDFDACKKALRRFSVSEVDILKEVYLSDLSVPAAITRASCVHQMSRAQIIHLTRVAEYETARIRGLTTLSKEVSTIYGD